MILNNKKGAMFGLDARIALAIFGALSVISGASLYSAIEQAKYTKTKASFNEILKAYEAYYLDTGSPLPKVSYNFTTLYIGDLIENRELISSWKGPYLTPINSSTTQIQNEITYDIYKDAYISLELLPKSTWTVTSPSCTINSSDCNVYIRIYPDSSPESLTPYFNYLDDYFDNNDGKTSGKIRWRDSVDSIYYQGMPAKRTS